MKLWKWQSGRQANCEYQKFPLWYFKIWKLGFDAYILKYEGDQMLPSHKDPIKDGKHWRLNIGWGRANFVCEKLIFGKIFGKMTIYLFRPDLYQHSLFIFDKTIKLSIGFAKYF